MDLLELEQKLKEAITKIESKGREYAEAKAISWQMQELKKVVLAQEMKNHSGSMASREMEARASERYGIHLEGTMVAIKKENILNAEVKRWKAQQETLRSLLSVEKSKMDLR